MYGQSPYGWQTKPRSSDVIELPLAPVRRPSDGGDCRNCRCVNWFTFGIILSLMAAASVALGVADVVVTYQKMMVDLDCAANQGMEPCMMNTLVFTWVGVGIWGGIAPFILGIMSIQRASNPTMKSSWFELMAFLSTFIFTPAMIVISAIEIWKGWNVFYWAYMAPLTEDMVVKFALPLAIAILAFVEHIMAFIAVAYICGCCDSNVEESRGWQSTPAVVTTKPQMRVVSAGPAGCSGRCQSNYGQSFYSTGPPLPSRPSSYNYNYRMSSGGPSAYNFFRG